MKSFVIALMAMLVISILVVTPGQAALTSCTQVNAVIVPCIAYLTKGGSPPVNCCAGVRNLKNMAASTADRRFACNCLKQASSRYTNIKEDAANSLPSKCGVTVGFTISRNVNCNAIN